MLNIAPKTDLIKFVVAETAESVAERLSAAYPLLAGQLEAGAAILARGDVLLTPHHNYVTVRSQNPRKIGTEYLVQNRHAIGWCCQCGEWQDGREARFYPREDAAPTQPGVGTVCKHTAAVWVAWELGLVPGQAL